MFERLLTRRRRALRALREFLDLSACRVFTVWQQIVWALALAALGAIAALVASDEYHRRHRAEVTLKTPVIERLAPDYSVYRIVFEHRGAESWCHIVIYGETGKWTVKC